MTGSEGVRCTTVNGQMLCSGSLEWSGNSCSVPPGAPPQEDEPPTRPDQSSCVPSADGQTFCLKPSGEACYSHANGRQTCWMPTETGTKPDGSNLQKRDAGTEAIPPANPNLPTGDTLEKSGESVNTTTTVSGAGGSTTINTTTTNYVTQHGTSAAPGQADQGEAGDGSGGGAEGGDGDEDKGSIEGGGDCEAPPVARGGDPIMVAVVDQAWATRCAVEAGNAAKVTGDVGDCKSDFSVEGTNANAEQLRAMRVAICGAEKRAEESKAENKEVADGTASELAGYESQLADAEARGIFGTGSGAPGTGINPGWLSFGGGSCPVISFEFPGVGTWEPPPAFCDLILALSLLFQLIAMVWALQIIGS